MGLFSNVTERKAVEAKMRAAGRLPPGQSATLKWPVLHTGSVPRFDPAVWDFRTTGLVTNPLRLSWRDFGLLPMIELVSDFHCVTRWSRFDNRWAGVPAKVILERTRPLGSAHYVLVHADGEYTTNLRLADLESGDVLFATDHDGEPLSPEHGGPLRLVVPKLYGWKSAKWVRGLEFLRDDRQGYWEARGYHERGDASKEERMGD